MEFPLYLKDMTHKVNTHICGGLQCLGGDVPWRGQCVPAVLASRLSVCDRSREVCERLMSADSCSRLWKLLLLIEITHVEMISQFTETVTKL